MNPAPRHEESPNEAERNAQADAAPDPHTEAMVRLTRLWSSAMPAVEAFIHAAVRDPHDRDDVIQATSEYLARHFDRYDPDSSFVSWAITVARYRVLELWRERSRSRLVLTDQALDAVADVAADLSPQISDRQEALRFCMDKLGRHQRQLLELRYTQSVTPAEIANLLGKSANAVSAALLRVRNALRRCVEQRLEGAGT